MNRKPAIFRKPSLGCSLSGLLLAASLLGNPSAAADIKDILFGKPKARVLVDTFASEEYLDTKETPDGPKRETYTFYKGKYYGGNIADSSLRKVSFADVVTVLEKDLKARNFVNSDDVENLDLMIVVHWGTTAVDDDWDDILATDPNEAMAEDFGNEPFVSSEDSEIGDEGQTEERLSEDDDEMHFANNFQRNARLLGFDRELNRRGLSAFEQDELRAMLNDERYFMILLAYDFQKLRKEGVFDLKWSTRFSLESNGTNFTDAYLALSRAASPYFGSNFDKLELNVTHLGEGEVKTGELEVIETVEDTNE